MKVSIFTTTYNAEERGEPYKEAMACYEDFADEVIEVKDEWPEEFEWKFIGKQFQKGYERATGDWVLHMDIDFLLHENDFDKLREKLFNHDNAVALSMWKYQFFVATRYNLKSRLVIAVNKKKYGDRIKFNAGGDLCQPSLDGNEIRTDDIPEARVPFYNYDETFKTKEQLLKSKGRFARAWQRHFGEYKLGGPDDESAYEKWLEMQTGRFEHHLSEVKIKDHPKYIQDKLKGLKPGQFGYDLFGGFDA